MSSSGTSETRFAVSADGTRIAYDVTGPDDGTRPALVIAEGALCHRAMGAAKTLIGAVQDRFPGFRFRLLGNPDGHGRWVRFSWGLGPEGADPLIEGSDVVEQDDGRIQRVIGFLDKVPAMA